MNNASSAAVALKPSNGEDRGRTLTTEFYERLRSDILRGQLAPDTKLRIDALSEQYAVGPTPVREALSRLSAEGLVDKRELRGFAVTGVSLTEIRSLTKTRCWLEEIALRESLRNRTDAWEEGVLIAFHRMTRLPRLESMNPPVPAPAADLLHWAYHDALVANCDSPSLLSYCKDLREKCDRYRSLAASSIYRPDRDPMAEHRAILDAVLANDVDTAVRNLVAHYKATLKQVERHFAV
ncbi:GntR family transcriptional regulator [uncultured Caballeronia sp.]|uniref:GntR family transcriptional regulator n=1 Tax=uncultured Caballeronia sp. TaxID=1827198 RepID=UPI001575BBF4